jgi:hypothetical protein
MIVKAKIPFDFFPEILKPISDCRSYIICLLSFIGKLNNGLNVKLKTSDYIYISLITEPKISRIYIQHNLKTTSIYFPFKVTGSKPLGYSFTFKGKVYSNPLISDALNYLELYPDFPKEISFNHIEVQDESEKRGLEMILPLIPLEPSYLRYEEDEKRESKTHPKYHFDINYSIDSTFKFGLSTRINLGQFQNILDNRVLRSNIYPPKIKRPRS